MKISLDRISFSCYTWKEIENIMTTNEGVKREVLDEIKRRVQPGAPVNKRMWRFAYDTVRARAIAETQIWKQKYITIEG